MMSVSGKLTPHALTSTTAWPAPARGDGTSSSTSASGGPKVLHTIAFMAGECNSVRQGLPQILGPAFVARQIEVDDEPPRRMAVRLHRLDAHDRAVALPGGDAAEVERVLAQELDLLVGAEAVEDARHRGRVGARLRQDVRAVAIDRQDVGLFLPPAEILLRRLVRRELVEARLEGG